MDFQDYSHSRRKSFLFTETLLIFLTIFFSEFASTPTSAKELFARNCMRLLCTPFWSWPLCLPRFPWVSSHEKVVNSYFGSSDRLLSAPTLHQPLLWLTWLAMCSLPRPTEALCPAAWLTSAECFLFPRAVLALGWIAVLPRYCPGCSVAVVSLLSTFKIIFKSVVAPEGQEVALSYFLWFPPGDPFISKVSIIPPKPREISISSLDLSPKFSFLKTCEFHQGTTSALLF